MLCNVQFQKNENFLFRDMGRKIEDVFIKGADFLKLYAEYSCNFSTAMKLIEQWKSKVPEFSRFILGIQVDISSNISL